MHLTWENLIGFVIGFPIGWLIAKLIWRLFERRRRKQDKRIAQAMCKLAAASVEAEKEFLASRALRALGGSSEVGMMITPWDYALAEETFSSGHEPRIVVFGDGTRAMLTNWQTDDRTRIGVYNIPPSIAWLTRWRDDLGAWCYLWTECNWFEYHKWLEECRLVRAVLRAPPSYHEQEIPDFIGEDLWREFHSREEG